MTFEQSQVLLFMLNQANQQLAVALYTYKSGIDLLVYLLSRKQKRSLALLNTWCRAASVLLWVLLQV